MNKALRGGNALWSIISIISLVCAFGLLYLMLQERSGRVATEKKLLDTQMAKQSVENQLSQTQAEVSKLQEQARLLADEIAQEKKNYQAALDEVTKREAQITELENKLANEKKQRTSLANDLAQLKEARDGLEEKLKEAAAKIEELNSQLEESAKSKPGVELKKIVVKSKEELSGKVLVVNREFHFVVIDLGQANGLSVGDEFVVYLDSKEIGRVQVEKVYDTMSTATILSGSQEELIVEDNIVKSF